MRFIFVLVGIAALVAFAFRFLGNASPSSVVVVPTPVASSESVPVASAQAVLKDTVGDLSTGIATRKIADDEFIVLVGAQMNPPSEGSFYAGWLIKRESGKVTAVLLGKLSRVSDASNLWQVDFRATASFTDYGEVWVTRERKDDDTPETIVLKGTWKE